MASAINKLSVTKIAKLVKDSEPGLTADGGRYADQQMGHGDLAVALLVRRQAQIDGPGQHQYPHSSGGPRTRRQGQQLLWVDPWVDLAVTSENPDGEVFAAVEDEIGLIEEAEDRRGRRRHPVLTYAINCEFSLHGLKSPSEDGAIHRELGMLSAKVDMLIEALRRAEEKFDASRASMDR